MSRSFKQSKCTRLVLACSEHAKTHILSLASCYHSSTGTCSGFPTPRFSRSTHTKVVGGIKCGHYAVTLLELTPIFTWYQQGLWFKLDIKKTLWKLASKSVSRQDYSVCPPYMNCFNLNCYHFDLLEVLHLNSNLATEHENLCDSQCYTDETNPIEG